jgi:hypothetical protein
LSVEALRGTRRVEGSDLHHRHSTTGHRPSKISIIAAMLPQLTAKGRTYQCPAFHPKST